MLFFRKVTVFLTIKSLFYLRSFQYKHLIAVVLVTNNKEQITNRADRVLDDQKNGFKPRP